MELSQYLVMGVGAFIVILILVVLIMLFSERRRVKDLRADIPDDIFVDDEDHNAHEHEEEMEDDMLGDGPDTYRLSDLIPDDEDDEPNTVVRDSLVKDDPDTPFNESSIHSTLPPRSPLPFKSRVQRARDGEL